MTGAASQGSDGGTRATSNVNAGVPTLTTPTLTPTTLTNIEQMFAESDPHAPPYQHENAAGFVPPIVSPTSGAFSPISLKLNDAINTPDTPLPLLSPSRGASKSSNGSLTFLSPTRGGNHSSESALPLLSPSKSLAPPPFLANSRKLRLLNGAIDKTDNNFIKQENSSSDTNTTITPGSAISRPQTLSIPRPVTLDLSCPRSRPQSLPLSQGSNKPKFVLNGEPPGALTSPRQDLPPSPQTPLSILAGLSSPILSGLASPSISSLTTSLPKSPTSPSLSQLLSVAAAAARSQFPSPRGGGSTGGGLLAPPSGSTGGGLLAPPPPPRTTPSFILTSADEGVGIVRENGLSHNGGEEKAEDLSISRPETPLLSPKTSNLYIKSEVKSEGGLPAKNIEFLDKFLKAAAAVSPMLNTPTSAMLISPGKDQDVGLLRAISPPPPHQPPALISLQQATPALISLQQQATTPTLSESQLTIAQSMSCSFEVDTSCEGSRSQVSSSQMTGVPASLKLRSDSAASDDRYPEDDYKKLQRRERNKLAAARCRKRRLDLTNQLQDEVSEWEKSVRSLKQELLELEQTKKGLQSVLNRHNGPCKVKKEAVTD